VDPPCFSYYYHYLLFSKLWVFAFQSGGDDAAKAIRGAERLKDSVKLKERAHEDEDDDEDDGADDADNEDDEEADDEGDGPAGNSGEPMSDEVEKLGIWCTAPGEMPRLIRFVRAAPSSVPLRSGSRVCNSERRTGLAPRSDRSHSGPTLSRSRWPSASLPDSRLCVLPTSSPVTGWFVGFSDDHAMRTTITTR